MHLSKAKRDNPVARFIFIRSKTNNKNRLEMGLLSLLNLEICIKKAEFYDSKGLKVIVRFSFTS